MDDQFIESYTNGSALDAQKALHVYLVRLDELQRHPDCPDDFEIDFARSRGINEARLAALHQYLGNTEKAKAFVAAALTHLPDQQAKTEEDVYNHNHIALHNREALDARGVTAINLISSPGSGKILLLEKTLEALNGKIKCAVITGDQQTDNDARRLAGKGAKIHQIETKTSCHLNADQAAALLEVLEDGTQVLFIENVGNMVCPTAFELGEHFKVALLSTPEGEDKPEKYPVLFATAKLALLTKMDLAEPLDWDLKACQRSIQSVHPGMMTFKLSAKTGEGMEAWLEYLGSLV